ncbi:ATP-binding protein [Marichromatium gracile]|uniref:ATP-binding protein n=1 Tax=Marichromatium gracile TaxID=1048 RepID=UPI001F1DF612|nr:ATP-binding protein [Marichromatium gracile]MCF1183306.1 ATP-binding protein [Marichromatium gracile]
MPQTKPDHLEPLARLAFILVMALGGAVILGWHLKLAPLIQLQPHLVPMQYNTALGLALSGAGLWALLEERRRTASGLALAIALIGALTLLQDTLQLDLGIDQLLMEHDITVATPVPGRMAPNTALSLVLCGAIILLLTGAKPWRWRLAGVLAGVLAGLGAVALLGYALDIPAAYGHDHFTVMAPHTAIALVVMGGGCMALVQGRRARDQGWIIVVIAILLSTFTLILWLALQVRYPIETSDRATTLMLIFGLAMALAVAGTMSQSIRAKRIAASLARHIARHRQTEETLRRFELLARHSRDIILFIRREDGRLLEVNDAAVASYGYSRAELLGMTVHDLRASTTQAILPAQMAEAHAQGLLFETEHRRRDGSTFPVEVSSQGARVGAIDTLISVIRDITERTRLQAALREHQTGLERLVEARTRELTLAKEQAEAATRTKSAFLANISHEIRTPLNAVLGLAYLLESRDLPDEAHDLARKIHHSGQSLLTILNDVLDVSKIESGKIEIEQVPFRLVTVIDNLATLMAATARERGKTLELVIAPPHCCDWPLRGDPLRLGQVLINLTNNAIKFTDSGVIEVRIDPIETDAQHIWLRFAVKDTGIGIDAATQARLFQPFTQADVSTTRRFGGSGLGLMISRRMVELMDGRVGLESRPGAGSTFWFELPFERLVEQGSDAPAAAPVRVLVVADDARVRDGLLATVTALGWSGHAVSCAGTALQQIVEEPSLQGPQAVVLINRPVAADHDPSTARAIREALPETRRPLLFVLTPHPLEQARTAPDAHLVDAMLVKPLAPSPFREAVARARGRHCGPTETPLHTPRPRRLAGLHLLIVDDSEINREVASRIFLDEGARVSVASDGEEALDHLMTRPETIDAVLMDVQMPRMDGHEATRRIRRIPALAGVPVIALTAGAMAAQQVSAREAGMDAFISKPFDVEEAVCIIRRMVQATGERRPTTWEHMPETPDVGHASNTMPPPQDLPGLALDHSLAVWKDAGTYRRYLDKFAREHGDTARRIAEADPETALRLAHRLHGVAGNLGLTEVAACAGKIERLTGDRHAQAALAAATTALQAALATALDSIARYVPQEPSARSSRPSPERDKTAPAPATLAPLLRTALAAFADLDIIAAKPAVTELAGSLPSEDIAPLQTAIEEFDASGGEVAARALAARLGLDLEARA